MTIYLNPATKAIPGLRVELRLNGEVVTPSNGLVGIFQRGDIEIILEIEASLDHHVFTLDHQLQPQDKALATRLPAGFVRSLNALETAGAANQVNFLKSSVYVKKAHVQPYKNLPATGKFPTNVVCVSINGDLYSVGVFCQFNRVFFAIVKVESIVPTENTPVGTVLSFNPFSGLASVYSGDPNSAYRIFWPNMPGAQNLNYCRVLPIGCLVTWMDEDVTHLDTPTTYAAEIVRLRSVEFVR